VLAVTVLTSLDAVGLGQVWGRERPDVEGEVLRLAGLAAEAGAHGLVCSAHEVASVRARFGDRLAPLVPGIRLAGGDAHDQARVATPESAADAGATRRAPPGRGAQTATARALACGARPG
jgi:orotidine-5'-phosphate decarboxylase